MNKFSYAPGKPGFGSKGDPGDPGKQGLSIYFTDYEPTTQEIIINSKIENNFVLWSNRPNETLPHNREYVTGDLFIDLLGNTYEIDASSNTFTYLYAALNVGGIFIPLDASTSDGYNRYFNSNDRQKYIIDNIQTNGDSIFYTQYPGYMYNIPIADYTRIEYTNINFGNKYPFTLYTIGENDNGALAIIYDSDENAFRIGNMNNDIIRNNSLIFDVSMLGINRILGQNTFNPNTPIGSILTNYEINANCLFTPNFNRNAESFYYELDSVLNKCIIYWNLTDITNDNSIEANLYFFEEIPSYNGLSFSLDSSALKPMIMYNIPIDGSILISDLKPNTGYKTYIQINKNGWVRKTAELDIWPVSLDVTLQNYTFSIDSHEDASIRILTNGLWSWQIIDNPSDFVTITSSPSEGAPIYDGSIYFNVNANDGAARTAILRVISKGGAYKDVSIYQTTEWITVPVTLSASSPITYSDVTPALTWASSFRNIQISTPSLPSNTVVDVTLKFKGTATNNNAVSGESSSIDSSIAIFGISKLPVYKTWTTTCPALSTKSSIPETLEITDIMIGNTPLNIHLFTKTSAYYMQSGDNISSASAFNTLTFVYRSGDKTLFTYNYTFANTVAYVDGYDGPPI